MKYTPYSYSKLSTWTSCPKKFEYQYIQKIKVPFVYNEALLKGGAIHSILEHYPEKSNHKLAEKYYDIAKTYIDSPRGQEILNYNSKNEISFGINSKLEPTEYKDKDAIFRGFIDKILIKENSITILDFKTGKFKVPEYQSYDQLLFYAVWFFIKFPEVNNIEIVYEYIEHLEYNSLLLHRDHLQNYKTKLIHLIHQIETSDDFPRSITKLCDYCDFQEYCEKEHKNVQNV